MHIARFHHVAYRCRDARETVEWYHKHLGMEFVLAIAEDHVPSTMRPTPTCTSSWTPGGGNILAFFELPNPPPMGRDQHARVGAAHRPEVERGRLLAAKARLEAAGVAVLGVTDHAIFKSIYFFDPNGQGVELAADTATPEMMRRLDAVKWDMLDEWTRTKRAPKHAAWMHEKELVPVEGA